MKRRVDQFLVMAGILVALFLLLPKEGEQDFIVAPALFAEGFLDTVESFEMQGGFAGKVMFAKQERLWHWYTEQAEYRRPASVERVWPELAMITLGMALDPEKVPEKVFSDAYTWTFRSPEGQVKLRVSKQANLESWYYLEKWQGNKHDVFLIDKKGQQALVPHLARFLALPFFLAAAGRDLVKIQSSYPVSLVRKDDHWQLQQADISIQVSHRLLQEALGDIEIKEAYPLESLSAEDRASLRIPSPEQYQKNRWSFTYAPATEKHFYVIESEGSLQYLVDPEQQILFRSFIADDAFFLGRLGSLLKMREYALVDFEGIDQVDCVSRQKAKSFVYEDGKFRSDEIEFAFVDVAQNLYNLSGSEISSDLLYREILSYKFFRNQKLVYEFLIGKQGENYVLQRGDLKYLYRLQEISKIGIENLMRICEGLHEPNGKF